MQRSKLSNKQSQMEEEKQTSINFAIKMQLQKKKTKLS